MATWSSFFCVTEAGGDESEVGHCGAEGPKWGGVYTAGVDAGLTPRGRRRRRREAMYPG